jgi:hypothetical protein
VLRHPFLAHLETPKPMVVDHEEGTFSANLTAKNTTVEHAIAYSKALCWISSMDGGPNGPCGSHAASVLYRFMSKVAVDVKRVLKYAHVCFALVQKAFYGQEITLEYYCPEEKMDKALQLLVKLESEVLKALDFKVLHCNIKLA